MTHNHYPDGFQISIQVRRHRDVTLSRPDKLSALSEEMYHGIAAQFSALDDLAVCGARLTHDHQEGVAAFKEKRPPRFTGR